VAKLTSPLTLEWAKFTGELSNVRRVPAGPGTGRARGRGRHRKSPYSVLVINQRQVVDYALQRRALLAEVRSGRVGSYEACDASPYLLRAAKFHGRAGDLPCPICRQEPLTLVSWVYGDELKHVAGSARTPEELARMAGRFAEFTVYDVEVCRACHWNHLVRSYVLGTGEPADGPRRTAGR
jgi:uncharacterized protein DUF5318